MAGLGPSLCVEIWQEKHRFWWESTTCLCNKYIKQSLKEDLFKASRIYHVE